MTEPALTAATSPAAATRPAAPLTGAREKMAAINAALKLSTQEADAYAVAVGRKTQLDDLALTMLLRKAASLPTLSGDEFKALDQPSVANLMQSPERYSGRPIRLRLYVLRVIKMTVGEDLVPTRYWGKDDGAIWRWDCVNADAERPADEPVMVLTAIEPNTVLGGPVKVNEYGHRVYRPNKPLDLAGVFYKLYATTNEDGGLQDYPVMLAWQAAGGRGISAEPDKMVTYTDTIVIAVGISAIFLVLALFKRIKDRHAPAANSQPRPTGQNDVQIDPDLAKAAEQYRKDNAIDGPDHKG